MPLKLHVSYEMIYTGIQLMQPLRSFGTSSEHVKPANLFNVLEDGLVLLGRQDAVAERTGVALHTSMHEVDVVKLKTHQAVNGFLLAALGKTSVSSLEQKKNIISIVNIFPFWLSILHIQLLLHFHYIYIIVYIFYVYVYIFYVYSYILYIA